MKKLLLLLAMTLAGCATNNSWHWERPNATQQEFAMDSGQCRAQALSGTGGAVTVGTVMIMNSCLQGKGWYQVPNS